MLYYLACYFLLYAFLGWCLEVVFCSVNTGKFVNRGFLNGPLCPIYGFGAVLVISLLSPLQNHLILLYIASVLLTSLLELVTGFVLKKLFHTSWWDYSNQPFNIGGYICLKFSLLWGIACLVLVKLIHPLLAGLVNLLPLWLGYTLLAVGYALLLADLTVTVVAIAKLNRDLGEITRLAEGLHKGSESMAQSLGNRAIAVASKIEQWDLEGQKERFSEKLDESKARVTTAVRNQKEKLGTRLDFAASKEKIDEIANRQTGVGKRLMRAFPNMRSSRYNEALQQIRQKLNIRTKTQAPPPADEKEAETPTKE